MKSSTHGGEKKIGCPAAEKPETCVYDKSVFYPAMQRYDELKEMVAESLEEHNNVKTLLKEMATLSDSEDFEDKLEELIDNVEHHAEDEEEGKMFPKVLELVSANELQKLGAQLQAAKDQRKAS